MGENSTGVWWAANRPSPSVHPTNTAVRIVPHLYDEVGEGVFTAKMKKVTHAQTLLYACILVAPHRIARDRIACLSDNALHLNRTDVDQTHKHENTQYIRSITKWTRTSSYTHPPIHTHTHTHL